MHTEGSSMLLARQARMVESRQEEKFTVGKREEMRVGVEKVGEETCLLGRSTTRSNRQACPRKGSRRTTG